MPTGSELVAIAVLTRTALAPISIAIVASEGRPIPASTIIGTSIELIKISINPFASSPRLLPIGEARGITQLAPASTSRFASIKLGLI